MNINAVTNYIGLVTFISVILILFFSYPDVGWFEIFLGIIVSITNLFTGRTNEKLNKY